MPDIHAHGQTAGVTVSNLGVPSDQGTSLDMLPPQAPPAHVTHANQAAIAALQRMQETQAWLVAQKDALPDVPTDADARGPFLADLDAFWEALVEHVPGKPSVPRRQALALRLAQTARDDASMRRNDGTLADEAAETIALVAGHASGDPLPGHVHARELFVGSAHYAGTLVLESDRDPDRVLLFTVDAGWKVFSSLDELYRDVELDFRGDVDPEGTPDTRLPGVRAIDGNVFDVLARRLVTRTRERVAASFDREGSVVPLQDRLHAVLDLSAILDVHAIVRQRDLALAAKVDEERLGRQPAPVREHWRQAASAYRDAWRRERDVVAAPSLAWFADTALWMALRERGIDVPPHEIGVRLTRRVPENPVSNLLSGFPHEDLPLVALAYRNIGNLATEHLQVIRDDGSVRDDVPAETIREIVRELDLPTRYARHLDDTLGHSVEGRRRRASHHALQAARMRFEAADARLGYFDPTEPRSFQEDHRERGFHWAQAVLDSPSPASRRKVEGHEIVVHQLTYKGAPLSGIFLISARQREAVYRVVLYTPDAPDGIAFREFRDRAELTRDFLLDPRFEGYLLDRLPMQFSAFDRTGTRHFATPTLNDGRSWKWVFNLSECNPRSRCTQLAERFQEREVTGSFLDADYDVAVQLAKRNAADLARTTARANWDSVFDVWGWNVPFHLVKEFVVGTVKSLPHAAQSGWRFYDHVKAGDGTGAFLAFVEGYTAGLSVLPLYTQIPASVGARMRAAPGSRTLVPTRRTLPAADTLFEKRFLARDVTVPSGRAPASGVYMIDGNRYIRQGGATYHVRFDPDIAGWRLNRPGALDARVSGPAIERLADGRWHFRHVGLRGGSGRGSALAMMMEEVKDVLDDTSRLSPDVAALSESQRIVLISELRRRLDLREFVATLRVQVERGASPLPVTTSTQRQAWDAALAAARATPPGAPPWTLAQALDIPERPAPGSSASSTQPVAGPSRPSAQPGPVPATNVLDVPRITPPPLVTYQRVAIRDWPDVAYVYLPREALAGQVGQGTITLPQLRIADGVNGVAVTTLPPDTLMSGALQRAVAMSPRAGGTGANATLGSTFGGWIQINMRMLKGMRSHQKHYPYRLFGIPGTGGHGFYLRDVIASRHGGHTVFGENPISLIGAEFSIGLHPQP